MHAMNSHAAQMTAGAAAGIGSAGIAPREVQPLEVAMGESENALAHLDLALNKLAERLHPITRAASMTPATKGEQAVGDAPSLMLAQVRKQREFADAMAGRVWDLINRLDV